MSALSSPRIFISLVVAIVVWAICRYFLYWLPGGMLVSILLSIVGAVVFTAVADNAARLMNASVPSFANAAIAAVGSATLLFVAMEALTVSNAVVRIDCNGGYASPDYVYITSGSTVKWTAGTSVVKSYTIRFKDKSPFDDPSGSQLTIISSNPTTGETLTYTVRPLGKGYYPYGFTCSNGKVVDPMIDVWK